MEFGIGALPVTVPCEPWFLFPIPGQFWMKEEDAEEQPMLVYEFDVPHEAIVDETLVMPELKVPPPPPGDPPGRRRSKKKAETEGETKKRRKSKGRQRPRKPSVLCGCGYRLPPSKRGAQIHATSARHVRWAGDTTNAPAPAPSRAERDAYYARAVKRWMEKKRNPQKAHTYESRRSFANRRPRVNGRFVGIHNKDDTRTPQ